MLRQITGLFRRPLLKKLLSALGEAEVHICTQISLVPCLLQAACGGLLATNITVLERPALWLQGYGPSCFTGLALRAQKLNHALGIAGHPSRIACAQVTAQCRRLLCQQDL